MKIEQICSLKIQKNISNTNLFLQNLKYYLMQHPYYSLKKYYDQHNSLP